MSDGVIAVEKSGLVQFINPRAERLTGLNEMQAIGKPLLEVFRLMDEGSGEFIDASTAKRYLHHRDAENAEIFY